MAKGIELPVNVLVIIVIAVLVLIALAALVAMGVVSATPLQVLGEKGGACSKFACGAATATSVSLNMDLGKDYAPHNKDLYGLCIYEKQCKNDLDATLIDGVIKTFCGCPSP